MAQLSKYEEALSKYNVDLNDEEIAEKVRRIIAEKVPENDRVEVKKFLMGSVELTTLKTTDSDESVLAFTEKVNQFEDAYPELPHVATEASLPTTNNVGASDLSISAVNVSS